MFKPSEDKPYKIKRYHAPKPTGKDTTEETHRNWEDAKKRLAKKKFKKSDLPF